MNYFLRVQILERLTEKTGDFKSILLWQRARGAKDMGQCASAQIFCDNVWSASLFLSREKFHDERVIESLSDLFLALKPRKKCWIRLISQMRHLYRHDLILVILVPVLVHVGHSAA